MTAEKQQRSRTHAIIEHNIRKHPIRVSRPKWVRTISSGIDFSINQTAGSRPDRYSKGTGTGGGGTGKNKYIFMLHNGQRVARNQLHMSRVFFFVPVKCIKFRSAARDRVHTRIALRASGHCTCTGAETIAYGRRTHAYGFRKADNDRAFEYLTFKRLEIPLVGN